MFASTETSSWILVAVTCEQIISITWPHKVRVICTSRSAIYVIICIHVIIYGASAHLLFGTGLGYVVTLQNKFTVDLVADLETTTVSNDTVTRIMHWFSDRKQGIHTNSVNNNVMNDQEKNVSTFEYNDTNEFIFRRTCGPLHNGHYMYFFNVIYPWMDLLLYFCIPALILTVGKGIIIKQIAKSRKLRMKTVPKSSATKHLPNGTPRSSITVLLLTVNTLFIVFTTPICVYLVGMNYWVDKDTGFTEEQEIAWCVVNLMMYLNHSLNFVSYLLSGTRFRRQFFRMCKKKPQRISWFTSRSRDHVPKQSATSSQTTVSVISNDVPMEDIVNNSAD